MKTRQLTRGAILLTLALIFQGLRLILPLPSFISVFIIGIMVNSVLVFGTWQISLEIMVIISFILPFVAYAQGQLPLPIFIPVIILGNWIYVWWIGNFHKDSKRVYMAAIAKAIVIYLGTVIILEFFSLSPIVKKSIGAIVAMGVHLFTGLGGIFLAKFAYRIGR